MAVSGESCSMGKRICQSRLWNVLLNEWAICTSGNVFMCVNCKFSLKLDLFPLVFVHFVGNIRMRSLMIVVRLLFLN